MGSPLALLLANWLVSQLETEYLNKTTKPKIYWRYVDDAYERLLMNFNSYVPQSWKKNLVKNLCYRNKNLVSEDLQNNEWQIVKEFLIKNSFPTKFIDDQIQKKNNFESELIKIQMITNTTLQYHMSKRYRRNFPRTSKLCSKTSE